MTQSEAQLYAAWHEVNGGEKHQPLFAELGKALTATELAKILGVDPRTIRRHYQRWGGVWVAPNVLRFFDNRVREAINANSDYAPRRTPLARTNMERRQGSCMQVVRVQQGRAAQSDLVGRGSAKGTGSQGCCGIHDPHGLLVRSGMGNGVSGRRAA